jgi:hypothetical protein
MKIEMELPLQAYIVLLYRDIYDRQVFKAKQQETQKESIYK